MSDPDKLKKIEEQPEAVKKPANENREDLVRELVNDLSEGEKAQMAKEVAVSLTEKAESGDSDEEDVSFWKVTEFQQIMTQLNDDVRGLEEASDSGREKLMEDARRKMMEMKDFLKYVRTYKQVEVVDGREIYYEADDKMIVLNEVEERISQIDSELKGVSGYEELNELRDKIRPKEFLKWRHGGRFEDMLKLISNIKSWEELKEEKLLVFDFGANNALEYQVGLGDVMPPKVRSISVDGLVYTRRANQGFYHKGRYLAIFTGTRVKVEVVDEGVEQKNEREYQEKFGQVEVKRSNVVEIAHDFGVDAQFLQVVGEVIGKDEENGISEEYEFLHIAARYIQNAESQYELRYGKATENYHYKAHFMVFALDRFNLFNIYAGRHYRAGEVIKKYGQLKGIDLQLDQETEKKREEERPRSVKEVRNMKNPEAYKGEVYYKPEDIFEGKEQMAKDMERRLQVLRSSLESDPNFPKESVEFAMTQARTIYSNMIARMGELYHSTVKIEKRRKGLNGGQPSGEWGITNSCVGHTMKVFEGTDFWLNEGRQKGKHAGNFVWCKINGKIDPYFPSLVGDAQIKVKNITSENIDALVSPHLIGGEPAVASLWDHVFWIYKKSDGRIWMCHSGADVRPKRVAVSEVAEMPPGYALNRAGTHYVRKEGSKVNELPLSYFLTKKHHNYFGGEISRKGLDFLKFVPLRNLVKANIPRRNVA